MQAIDTNESICNGMNSKRRRSRFRRSLLTIAIAVSSATIAVTQEPAKQIFSGPGYSLLSNGRVIKGSVEPLGAEVEIKLDDTGVVRFPNQQVVFSANTLDELYLFQANRNREWNTGDHLKLGQWCAENGLFDRAMPHYEHLKKEIGHHPEFARFQAELRDAMLNDPETIDAMRSVGLERQTAAANSNLANSANTKSTSSSFARVSNESQVTFRQTIQPVLVSSCARAACHGAFSSNGLTLVDMSRMSSRDATEQNLRTFATYVDGRKGSVDSITEEHILFQKSTQAHGKLLQSPLDINDPNHQKYLEELRLWIARSNAAQFVSSGEVANLQSATESNVAPASFSQPAFASQSPIATPPALGPQAAAWEQQQRKDRSGGILSGGELAQLGEAITRLEAIEKEKDAKRNPLDPAEFNSRSEKK
jgi:hypothetical protein